MTKHDLLSVEMGASLRLHHTYGVKLGDSFCHLSHRTGTFPSPE